MPLERLTMLVVPADGDAVLVVPRLEAPRGGPRRRRVRAAARGTRPTTRSRSWPSMLAGATAPRRSATRPGPGSSSQLQDAAARRALPPRARGDRPAAPGQGRRTRSTPCAAAAHAVDDIAGRDARPPVRRSRARSTCTASWSTACSTPGTSAPTSPSSPQAENAASPHHDPGDRGDRARRRRAVRLRRHHARLLLRHHAHVRGRRARARGARRIRRARRGAGGGRAGRDRRHAVRGRRRGRRAA